MLTLKILRTTYKVASLRDARDLWTRVRDEKGFGYHRQAETIVMDGEEPVARISYNGRVWEPGDWINAKEIKI